MAVETYRYPHFKSSFLLKDMSFGDAPKPGEEFPDFDLQTVEGRRIRKQDFLGKSPVLFTLGSLTCPMTASASRVLKRLHADFGHRVQFVTVYVREAHPGDRVPQPEHFDEKIDHAKFYRWRDGIPWMIAVDDLDGEFHQKLGSLHNAAYLMDAEGRVAYRALWSNDGRSLRQALEGAVAGRRTPLGEGRHRLVPMLSGVGMMAETLETAGPTAKRDVLTQAPPVYALSQLASVFRPLPPLMRSLAAIALGGFIVTVGMRGLGFLRQGD